MEQVLITLRYLPNASRKIVSDYVLHVIGAILGQYSLYSVLAQLRQKIITVM